MLANRSGEHQLIYLDIEFIADLYDAMGDSGVPTTISKTQGGNTGINVGFVNAGMQATETRQYRLTTKAMYRDLESQLEQFPTLKERPSNSSQLFWLNGVLKTRTVQSTRRLRGEITGQEEGRFFAIESSSANFALLASPSYFAYNYASILGHTSMIRSEFTLEVRCLIKPVSENKRELRAVKTDFIGSPLVMLEKPSAFSS